MLPGRDRKSGDIRLVGGRNPWEGRVQVFSSGVWVMSVVGMHLVMKLLLSVVNLDIALMVIGTWDFNVKKRLSLGD